MSIADVASILVEDRSRRVYRGIDSLAASIETIGLLHPLVITPDMRLVAGGRRLEAIKALGWTRVSVTVANNLSEVKDMLQAESDENAEREPLLPTEAEELAAKIEALLKPLARERQGERTDLELSGKLPESPEPRPREVAAKAAGFSATSIRKVREVKEIVTEISTPEPVRAAAVEALAEMDATGRVDGAYRRVKDVEEIVNTQPSEAVAQFVEDGQALQDARYVLAFHKAVAKADDFLRFDAKRLASIDPETTRSVEHLLKSTETFLARMNAHGGLRLVAGGKQ